jgi:hypothetical protein
MKITTTSKASATRDKIQLDASMPMEEMQMQHN